MHNTGDYGRVPKSGLTAIALLAALLLAACGVEPPGKPTSGSTASAPGQGSATSSTTRHKSPSPSPTPPPPPMLLDSIVPADGTTVGVAMPIVVIFSRPVKKSARAGIENAMKLTASTPVIGAWHWFSNRQVDFRPKDYWPAGDRVSLDAEFKGVPDGHGREGTHSYIHRFRIGEDFETKISVTKHTTKVYGDGKLIRSMSSDAGSPDFPSWDGTMSVSEKVRNEHMTSCSAGITCDKNSPNYYDGFYPWAVRLTYSGTFVHYSDADPYPGHSYGSHGCVHLSLADATWYFRHVSIGDPVTITGSPRGKAAGDNGYAVYNLSWTEWLQKSGRGEFTTS
ncbi:L,D-transpeptidase family protein [Microlunatus sp. Gsoil 973]|nr:L,D-transpeptidase family protein [Microlunatus sp. Gsoil 973]